MVPVLGVPIYNRVDLLLRCLRSVDFPVRLLVVVDNGGLGCGLNTAVCEAVESHPHIADYLIHRPEGNIGVAGAWNYLLHQHCSPSRTGGDYVLICNNDIEWAAGDLQKMHEAVRSNSELEAVFGNWSYSNFIITAKGRETLGYFDENFWPAYLEDGDHWRRIVLSQAKICHAVGVSAVHGENGRGSCTIGSDAVLARNNTVTHGKNWDYYRRKWGWGGGEVREVYSAPFNDAKLPLNYWQLMPERFDQPYYLPGSWGERHERLDANSGREAAAATDRREP
jgi:hypothetical protein